MTVRTRFAPSPTGQLHLGGARTALFSWLYARHCQGRFVLRIEDTDRERSTAEATRSILEGLDWLGLRADEGPYYQTERMERYRTAIDELLRAGRAYRCYCNREELEKMRAEAVARGDKPRYNGRCRRRTAPPAPGTPFVVRFRTPQTGQVTVDDLVQGRVSYDNGELDDLVLARSDGAPTYNLTVVVDDRDMQISHVIRGDDHLNNTPRQLHLFEAFDAPPPRYAHVPLILGADGTRLSKRHGADGVLAYREEGYLPTALLNYLARLGWSHGDQELFEVEELTARFDIAGVNRAAARFDSDKLRWCNQRHLQRCKPADLLEPLGTQLRALGADLREGPDLERVIQVQCERHATLKEIAQDSLVYYRDPPSWDLRAVRKFFREGTAAALQETIVRLANLERWEPESIQEALRTVTRERGLKFGQLAQPLRILVCGVPASPPIDATLELLGRERTLQRLRQGLSRMEAR